MSKKNNSNKNTELFTVHSVLKTLQKCSAVTLRKELVAKYSHIWATTGNQPRSDEKRIKGILNKLVTYGLATKKKESQEWVYTYTYGSSILDRIHEVANEQNIDFDNMKTYYKRINSIIYLLNDVSDNYYIQIQQEDIGDKEQLIKDLELAIEKRNKVTINHKNRSYTVSPLKIALFDGYWYLIAYNTKYFTYRIKDISHIKIKDETYRTDIVKSLDLNEWHNIWHDPMGEQKKILLHINKMVFPYFKAKNILGINTHKERLIPCNDGWEYECHITHPWELLPTLMQWQQYVTVLEREDGAEFIDDYRNILKSALEKLPLISNNRASAS